MTKNEDREKWQSVWRKSVKTVETKIKSLIDKV